MKILSANRTVFALFLLLGLALPLGATDLPVAGQTAGPAQKLIFPEKGAYTGAYVDFGDGEDNITLEALEKFEKMVGKHQAIIAFGNFWGEQAFPKKNVMIVTHYGATPLIFWSPWDKPYSEGLLPDRFNLYNILSGAWDAYIDKWAEDARDCGKPLLVAWGIEMNGTWFPWSGYYYGGGQKDLLNPPNDPLGPKIYKEAYRYVVNRVRAKGVKNIQWVFHVNNQSYPPEGTWNRYASYYPGADYVDVLALSVYGKISKYMGWGSFSDVFRLAYEELRKVAPNKPLIVAEWGIGEYPQDGNKAEWIKNAFQDFQERFPQVKAAVFWHERWQNKDESYSNLRVNSSPEALSAYREGVSNPRWLSLPQYQPEK
ncbi:MAG: glycosyl hydrolase [Desulfocapsaceae bacterium]|nr:glycosyl hydrolase [Desulfocapsaceae bacterium]